MGMLVNTIPTTETITPMRDMGSKASASSPSAVTPDVLDSMSYGHTSKKLRASARSRIYDEHTMLNGVG